MSEEIIKVLDSLCEKFGIAIDWTSQNVKPYLQELFVKYTNYEMATSIMWLVIFLLALVASVLFIRWCFNTDEGYEDGSVVQWIIYVAPLILFFVCVISIIGICCQTVDIIKCNTFPEKMIIDKILNITNGQ